MMRKLARSMQCFFPGGRDGREAVSRYVRRFRGQPHEEEFLALRHFPPEQLLLDVGTNYGQSVDSMLLVQPRCRIVGYEANGKLAEQMTDLFQADWRVEVKSFGLSDKSGTFDLHVPHYRNFSYPGLASVHADGAATLLSPDTLLFYHEKHVSIQRVKCCLETLDQQDLSPYFIKMDVQGAEFEVLQGGADTLARCFPILMIEAPGGDGRIRPFLRLLGYEEYEYRGGKFRGAATSVNRFFMTNARRDELLQRTPGLFA